MAQQKQQPADTRERILSAAESLFMERGYVATSLRTITAKAKVNLAAVNYHFGSKDALIREVFQRRVGPLNSARIAHLDRLESGAGGRPLTTEQIMEAIVTPALQASKDPLGAGAVFLRLLGQAFSEPTRSMSEILPAQYRQVVVRFKEALMRALPDLPDQELIWRMHFMFGALSYTMVGHDALKPIATCNLEGVDQPESIIRRLVPFLSAGLQAPAPRAQQKRVNPPRKIASVSGRKAA
jgi:AcrR family transcriptional regulator